MSAVRNCCYVAVCSAARGASAPTGGGEGRGHTVAPRPPTACFISNVSRSLKVLRHEQMEQVQVLRLTAAALADIHGPVEGGYADLS